MQGGLEIESGQRTRTMEGRKRVQPHPFPVTPDRHENHPQPPGDLLDQRIRQLLHPDPATRPDQGGEGGGDGLTGVAGEEQLRRRGPPPGESEQVGGGLTGGSGPVGGARPHGLRQHITPQQRREGGREQLRLPRHGRVVELQVDGSGGDGRLDERPPLRDDRRGPHECSPPHLPHHQPAPHEFAVHPSGRRGRDAMPPREPPLRRQLLAGTEPPGGDVTGDAVGDGPVVVHVSAPLP